MNGLRRLFHASCWWLAGAAIGLFAGTAVSANEHGPMQISNTQLETVEWSEIDGWATDDHVAAFFAFLNSCKVMIRGTPPGREGSVLYAALQATCRRALAAQPRNDETARVFFEQNFRPMRIAPLGESKGFLTGYYEPIVHGSRVASAEYHVPVYRTPPNLALRTPRRKAASATPAAPGWRRFAHRVTGFFYDRAAIEEGALAGRKLEICWVKDPTDLFFAQIQGSARVKLEDGSILRINYDGHNGWPYTPIGRILIERNIVPKDEMSMDRIRDWMQANPDEGKELRRRNKSFVFFRETGLADHEEPVGAQGVSLTPGRSIAVDKFIHIYGTPFFIDAELPIVSEKSPARFRRLMVAQDTGGAILGPARADLYFGAGDEPAHVAGRIRHPGEFTMLIPRDIDPVTAGARTPLPRPRPAFANIENKIENKAEDKPAKSSEQPAADQNKQSNAAPKPEPAQ
jgi:membrane-bound lytic murein transglycosylase A